ncbi:MAG: PrsW family intramembrane metalloprotease [Thermoplasmata archaeon]
MDKVLNTVKDLVKMYALIMACALIFASVLISISVVFGSSASCFWAVGSLLLFCGIGIPAIWVILTRKYEYLGIGKTSDPLKEAIAAMGVEPGTPPEKVQIEYRKKVRTLDLPHWGIILAMFFVTYVITVVIAFIAEAVSLWFIIVGIPFLIIMVSAPAMFWIDWLYTRDVHEPEPEGAVFAAFTWGMLSCVPSLLVNTFNLVLASVIAGPVCAAFCGAVISAPVFEELFKSIGFLFVKKEIDTELDGMIYGFSMGVGFSVVENFLYAYQTFMSGGAVLFAINALIRSVWCILLHAIGPGMVGFFLGWAYRTNNKGKIPLCVLGGYAIGLVNHALWNFTTFFGIFGIIFGFFWFFVEVGAMVFVAYKAKKADDRWYEEHKDELDRGIKPAQGAPPVMPAVFIPAPPLPVPYPAGVPPHPATSPPPVVYIVPTPAPQYPAPPPQPQGVYPAPPQKPQV